MKNSIHIWLLITLAFLEIVKWSRIVLNGKICLRELSASSWWTLPRKFHKKSNFSRLSLKSKFWCRVRSFNGIWETHQANKKPQVEASLMIRPKVISPAEISFTQVCCKKEKSPNLRSRALSGRHFDIYSFLHSMAQSSSFNACATYPAWT